MAESTSKIIISSDVSGAVEGVNRVKSSLGDMEQAARRAGKEGDAGVQKFGNAAGNTAKQVERASKSIERSIQRDIAVSKAGHRATREYYEILASQRGIAATRFEPLLKQLDAANTKVVRNTLSAKQYQNAMRMAPAQLTDIVTQLAGGQNPFLIGIQQGGQLRDSFGGFGAMFKGLASIITPARLAFTGLAGGVAALGYAMYQGSEESREYQKAVTLAGAGAGITADRLQDLAVSVGATTRNYGAAREAALAFARAGSISAADYRQFMQSVVTMSEASGKSVEDLVADFTKIAEDPVKAVITLSEKYKLMTVEVYNQASALVEQGKKQEAVRMVQQKFAEENDTMTKDVTENLGMIERAWRGIGDGVEWAWESLKSLGRDRTTQDEIGRLLESVKSLEDAKKHVGQGSILDKNYDKLIIQHQEQIGRLQSKMILDDVRKITDKVKSKTQFDAIAATKRTQDIIEAGLDNQQKRAKELNKIYQDRDFRLAAVSNNAKEVARIERETAQAVAATNEKYKERTKKAKIDRTVFPTTSEGLRVKPGAEAGGRAIPGTYAMAHAMKQMLGNDLFQFGAFRDRYHIGKNSLHNQGMAFDATPTPGMSREKKLSIPQQVNAYLESLGFASGKDFNIKFEPKGQRNKNGTTSTADHWHFNWRSKEAAARFAGGVGGQAKNMAHLGLFREEKDLYAEKMALMERTLVLVGKTTEAERLNYELNLGSMRDLSVEQKMQLIAKQGQTDAAKEAWAEEQKYQSLIEKITGSKAIEAYYQEISMIGRAWVGGKMSAEQYQLALARVELPEQLKNPEDWLGGMQSGVQQFIANTGSMRDQFANITESTLSTVADGLGNLFTGAKVSFRDMARSILSELAKIYIRMAMMKLVSSVSSSFSGGGGSVPGSFSAGGFTGDGGRFEPAGIVHKGEYVLNQENVRRLGGVSGIEDLLGRVRHGYANGGPVGMPSPAVRATGGGGMGNTTVNVTINSNGETDGDARSDTEQGKALGKALPVMVEQWYVNNVARVGAPYYRG